MFWTAAAVKLTLLTVAVVSGLTEGVLYTNADVSFFKNPLQIASGAAMTGADTIFQLNNALRKNAKACGEMHPKYWDTEDLNRIELNTGLVYVRNSPGAINLMTRALRNLYDEN